MVETSIPLLVSYPCSLLVQAPAGGDRQIAVRLGDGLGICQAIKKKGALLIH